jgi:hypothetical protein
LNFAVNDDKNLCSRAYTGGFEKEKKLAAGE